MNWTKSDKLKCEEISLLADTQSPRYEVFILLRLSSRLSPCSLFSGETETIPGLEAQYISYSAP